MGRAQPEPPRAVVWRDCRLAATLSVASQPRNGLGDIEVRDLKRISGEVTLPSFSVLTAEFGIHPLLGRISSIASPTALVPLTAMSLLSLIVAPQNPRPIW